GPGQLRLEGLPAPRRKVRPQTTFDVDRFADIQRTAAAILQDVNARRLWRRSNDPLTQPCPDFAPVLDHERLVHEPPGHRWRGIVNREHFFGKANVVRYVAHFAQTRLQAIAQQHRWIVKPFSQPPGQRRSGLADAGESRWRQRYDV